MGIKEDNGHLAKLDAIESRVAGVEDTLQHSIYHLTNAINRMADKFEVFIEKSTETVPAKLAMLMFILAFGAVAGVKTLDALIQRYLLSSP